MSDYRRSGDSEIGFSTRRTSELVGITYRQLDYWARTDLVRPSFMDATGSGSRRCYSRRDLFDLLVIGDLLRSGMRLEQVRIVLPRLRECGEDRIVIIDGTDVTPVDDADDIIGVLRDTRRVVQVLVLGEIRDRLDTIVADHNRRMAGVVQS